MGSNSSNFVASLFLVICCLQISPSLQACTDSCEQIWDPVCGSNGRNYANKCVAKCAGVSVKHTGRCKTFASDLAALQRGVFACTDSCEQLWDPVCGGDGKTYANKCIAKCAGVSVKHTGRCKTFVSELTTPQMGAFACVDGCEQLWDPVCGSDGKTYANKCIAKCAGVSVKHTGRCKTFASELTTPQMGAFACVDGCEQLWDPVCGSDGKTYANKCIAKCAGVSVKNAGRCTFSLDGMTSGRHLCDDKSEKQVCGSNGKTYASMCQAAVSGASVAHAGPCRSCSGVYDPVCGEDDRTYTNACLAQRANVSVKHLGPCMR